VERPRLKAHFRAVVDGENVFLAAEDRHFLVQGRGAVAILPYLDGQHTIADIAVSLRAEVAPPDILRAVRRYEMYDALANGRPALPQAELAYWDALGVDAVNQAGALGPAPVTVLTVGPVGAGPMAEALNAVGLTARAAGSPDAESRDAGADAEAAGTGADAEAAGTGADAEAAGMLVVVTDDYLRPELTSINAAMLAAGRRWVLTKPTGLMPWLGPLFEPGVTGCLACLQQRLRGNRQVERYLLGKFGDNTLLPEQPPAIPAGMNAVAGLLAGELARIAAAEGGTVLHGKMVTIDLRTLQTDEHLLVRRPQCPACGDPDLMARRGPKVTIESRPVSHWTSGGLRTQDLAATFGRLNRHISPYLGAVSSLRTHAATDNGIVYTYTAGHNFAMIGDNMGLLRRNIRGQSGGKGRTELQAKVSAVCEAIERYSAVCGGDEPAVRAAFCDLGDDQAIHPHRLLMFSPAQYENRAEWNRDPAHRLHSVPEPFRADLPVDWTPAWSLTHERQRLVPAAYSWYGHPDVKEHFYCFADSNGTAAGNCPEEAIVQGFCELAERDAVALWWYNRVRRPGVDLDSLRDPYVDAVRDLYTSMGRSLWMLDITSDLGIPAFAGVSHRIGHPAEDILVGFGAHLDPRIAAMRALTEVNQFLPVVERRDADGNTQYMEDEIGALTWWREAKIAEEPWLCPDDSVPLRKVTDYPVREDDDLASWVEQCVRAAESAGTEVIVLNQTRPDLELSVVRVIAPGLRHFWRRLGAGRLYDVPVQQGWLAEPTPEDGFNHWNVFF
jgi:bacteriocin biosynthesis cyclodehydratase domain-containing protein